MRETKSCEYCGTQLPGDAKYCASCGNFVTSPQQAPSPQPAPQVTPADDPMQTLTKLKGMLDAGLITQDEYDAKKAEILSKM